MRLPVPFSGENAWTLGHPWATFYDWMVESEAVGHRLARLASGTDLRLLHHAADVVGGLPAGRAVLDVPCGGGVALRGLRPGQGLRYVAADIAPSMLERTREAAEERGVADQVELVEADVARLPFDAATFDLVLSLTGLHCFPEPRAAVVELGRVAKPGALLNGSAVLRDAGLRHVPMRLAGRATGLMGPGATTPELREWLAAAGFEPPELRVSGPLTYFTARRRA